MSTKKSEKLFEAFTELDDDLIENALPKNQDYDVVKPALKIQSWKPWVAGAAVAAAALGVVFAGFKLFGSGKIGFSPAVESGDNSGITVDDVKCAEMIVDWVVYGSAQELADASDIICTGKVNDISFALIDPRTGKEIEDGDDASNAELCTVYDIMVTKMYRTSVINKGRLWFRVMGGMKDYKLEEQVELLNRMGSDTITVMSDPPEIEIGESYLFLLANFDYAPAGGSRLPTLINAPQGVFPLSDPEYTDEFSGASAQDIINCVPGDAAVENYRELSITHYNETISLADIDRDALAGAVQKALSDLENLLNMNCNTWDNEMYGQSGYVIDLVFNDIDASLLNGGSNKKAQTICHAKVFIGEYLTDSYISYSYTAFDTDGNSENYDGGTYFLGDEYRETMLTLIGARNHDDCEPVMLLDYYDNPDKIVKQYTKNFTVPEFPDAKFDYNCGYNVMARTDDKYILYSGSPVYGVYLADLNGDGMREICSTTDTCVCAYDFANGYLYELANTDDCKYSLQIVDGELMYVETAEKYQTGDPLTLGAMTCHSTTPGVHHQEHDTQTSHHDEPEHTAVTPTVTPTPTVTTGTHHDETHDETHH